MTDSETLISVRQAIDEYSLLCFPDQDMSDEKQLAFTRLLGTPEAEHVLYGSTGVHPNHFRRWCGGSWRSRAVAQRPAA